MSSSLPQLLGNYISHNCMYGLAVFCRKDSENTEPREGSWPGQDGMGGEEGGRDRRGLEGEGREGQENLNEEGELFAWESELDSEDERHSARRSISVALVESNCLNFNGGTEPGKTRVKVLHFSTIFSSALSHIFPVLKFSTLKPFCSVKQKLG